MKRFEYRQIEEALVYAKNGGQALHVWNPNGWDKGEKVPQAFKRNNKLWAHLFDYDRARLVATTKRLGVRVIKVDSDGRRGQHTDLCGIPLEHAIEQCRKDAEIEKEGETNWTDRDAQEVLDWAKSQKAKESSDG